MEEGRWEESIGLQNFISAARWYVLKEDVIA
jgi:hypothetical protein